MPTTDDPTKDFIEEETRKAARAKPQYTISKINSYTEVVDELMHTIPLYYDMSLTFWKYQDKQWQRTDETDLLNLFSRTLLFSGDLTISCKTKLVEALKMQARMSKPLDFPKHWIQFATSTYDFEKGYELEATHEYFCTNQIPHKLGTSVETPILDKLFTEWVGPDKVRTLYEIIAYCCYTGSPIHAIFFFVGSGRNGKGQFLSIIDKFLGDSNITSKELETLSERFQTLSLHKKLACRIGETNFSVLKKSSILKSISGNDPIEFEPKGGKSFTERCYAKLLIASNSLPESEDTSDGFFRRCYVVPFQNEFEEGKDIVATIPESEYEALARKVCTILPEVLHAGKIHGIGTIEERKAAYIEWSNPISKFITECCTDRAFDDVEYGVFYSTYIKWLQVNKKRAISRKSLSAILAKEGYQIDRPNIRQSDGGYKRVHLIQGLNLTDSARAKFTRTSLGSLDSLDSSVRVDKYGTELKSAATETTETFSEIIKTFNNDSGIIKETFPMEHLEIKGLSKKPKDYVLIAISQLGNSAVSWDDLAAKTGAEGITTQQLNACLDSLQAQGDIFQVPAGYYHITDKKDITAATHHTNGGIP
jgi:P4 family phage/plasmid primase-like protien